jgi:hypothetical protein
VWDEHRLRSFRPAVDLLFGVAERPTDVAHRRARTVGDDVRHLGGVLTSVAFIDVGDHLVPAARLDVDVDVGWTLAGRRQEALEEQAECDGVGTFVIPSA